MPSYADLHNSERLQQCSDVLLKTAADLGLDWLDTIYLFGVVARGLTNTAPLPVFQAEREALQAYMAGNAAKINPIE